MKGLSEDWAEPGAAVVATKPWREILTIAGLLVAIVLPFQNCGVELSDQTPGAGACEVTNQQLTDFQTVLTTFLQATAPLPGGGQACGLCHLTTSGNPAATRFGILPGTTPADQSKNFCTTRAEASSFSAGFLSNGSHLGGNYAAPDVQPLVNWATTAQ